MNRLILGDNLEIMKTLESESVDLIYLDPPFFSNRNYEVIWGDEGEIRSFQDRWAGGIDHYISWLKERVELMHRLLKPTGSIFLHCDWHANAHIRVEILDKIFGAKNFLNEIAWHYYNKFQGNINKLAANFDTIFWYSKSRKFIFNKQREKRDAPIKQIKRVWDKENSKIVNAKDEGGKVQYIETDEKTVDNVWRISMLQPADKKERIGYPTQKPEALLERIIQMVSNEGDVVLDPFMGGGTTMAVAERLKRQWIGIDQSVTAVKVTEMRLDKQRNFFSAPFSVQLQKYDYNKLRYEEPFEFESWIVEQFGGEPNIKKRGDFGLDGRKGGIPIQVKRSDGIGRNIIDNFRSAVERADKKLFDKNVREKKPVGYIIAFSFSKGAIEEAARLKLKANVIIELVLVDSIVPIANGPTEITVKMRELSRDAKGGTEIEFSAKTKNGSEINFYSWDFDYNVEQGFKASAMIDYDGKQTQQFKAGEYMIAVKAVDVEGLECLEIFKIKVNGIVKKMSHRQRL